jgi:hypothetical protein
MALAEARRRSKLAPILDDVARGLGRHGVKPGSAQGAPAALRVTIEENVRRMVQVYWTPFQIDMQGACVGLHLEVAEPHVHWTEAYISPTEVSWVLNFHERPDGEIELAYYREYSTWQEGVRGFFNLASWYTLAATDKTWSDAVYETAPGVEWSEHLRGVAGETTGAAIQESLKKSTILWLRWRLNGTEKTMPVWFLYDSKADRLFVLSGERQQRITGAERLRECDVILRWKGQNASVAEIPASVRVITGADADWDEVAEKVAEKRLNIPGLPEDTAERWREECVILELSLRT